jgi:hypothetical protein
LASSCSVVAVIAPPKYLRDQSNEFVAKLPAFVCCVKQ